MRYEGVPLPAPFTTLCENYKAMDKYFDTPVDSPLHHDNRCRECFPISPSHESK